MSHTLTKPHIVGHHVPFNGQVVGAVSCDRWGVTVVEGTVPDVRRLNVGHGTSVNKCHSTARVPGINVTLLTAAHKLNIGNSGIAYNKGKTFNRFSSEVDIVILLFLASIRICFINSYVHDIYLDLERAASRQKH